VEPAEGLRGSGVFPRLKGVAHTPHKQVEWIPAILYSGGGRWERNGQNKEDKQRTDSSRSGRYPYIRRLMATRLTVNSRKKRWKLCLSACTAATNHTRTHTHTHTCAHTHIHTHTHAHTPLTLRRRHPGHPPHPHTHAHTHTHYTHYITG
jgi:hypothetical protein